MENPENLGSHGNIWDFFFNTRSLQCENHLQMGSFGAMFEVCSIGHGLSGVWGIVEITKGLAW